MTRFAIAQTCLVVLLFLQTGCSMARSDPPGTQTAQAHTSSTLTLGMNHPTAVDIIRRHGGQDVTANQAIQGPNGERPSDGLYWSLDQYNSILEIGENDGNLVLIDYWTLDDYSVSKLHREESKRNLRSLTFEAQTHTVKIQLLD